MVYKIVIRVLPIKDKKVLAMSAINNQLSAKTQEANIDKSRSRLNQITFGSTDIVKDVQIIRAGFKEARKGEGPMAA